ncbi:MAG TPA: hypothetical protein VK537_06085 [Galbitalea sp.]|nr:hypothetical protein [Galbitalea sp.]
MNTSLQRTYRNLRLGIAGTVVVIGVSVGVESAKLGVLPSISDYFYTPARTLFVGALIAAALGIITLSGRGVQRAFLGAAGLFAPLVALVPTPILDGTVPGYETACKPHTTCVPKEFLADIDTGISTYLIVGGLAFILAIVLSVVQIRRTDENHISLSSVLPSLIVAGVTLAAVAGTWIGARDWFIGVAHLGSATIFFSLIGAVAVANAFGHPTGPDAQPASSTWRKSVYWVIAAGLFADLIVMVIVFATGHEGDTSPPPLFMGEFVALTLFVAFWIVQSIQKWNETNPNAAAS